MPRTRGVPPVRITSIGHAGLLLETAAGRIVCDPWFTPAYFGPWVPFPANPAIDPDLLPDPAYPSAPHLPPTPFTPASPNPPTPKPPPLPLPASPPPPL